MSTDLIIMVVKLCKHSSFLLETISVDFDVTDQLLIKFSDSLSWKNHIDSLIPKLISACYAIRAIKPFVNQETLLMVYYAYFHSIIRYGVIFWGNSSYAIVFYLQKRMIRIITGIGNRTSGKHSFIALKILTLSFLYIYSLLCFVVDNMDQYYFVSDIHNRKTREVLNLIFTTHPPNPLVIMSKRLILYGHQTTLSTIKFETIIQRC
jgi:hypothetical protein